jgi:hypothetical protein
VPPSAASNRPIRALVAPVNAPTSAPNSSASSSSSGRPPALTLTNGCWRRGRVGLDDLGDLLLAGAVGPGDQHRGVGARDAGGERDHAVHRLAGVDEAAQVVAVLQLVAGAGALGPQAVVLQRELPHAQHVLHGGDDLGVVPRLGEVVGGALLDEGDRGLERGPRGHQEDGQVAVELAQATKQRGALLARGRVVAEVHVLDDGADVTLGDQLERGLRRVGDLRRDPVDVEQDLEGRAHRRVVVDDQYLLHGASVVPASPGR